MEDLQELGREENYEALQSARQRSQRRKKGWKERESKKKEKERKRKKKQRGDSSGRPSSLSSKGTKNEKHAAPLSILQCIFDETKFCHVWILHVGFKSPIDFQ